MKKVEKIGILGAGNIGLALAHGLLDKGFKVCVTSKNNTKALEALKLVTTSNTDAAQNNSCIVLAVRPKQVPGLAEEIKDVLKSNTLVISIASGVSIQELSNLLGDHTRIVRVMPNTAIEASESMTCIAGKNKEDVAIAQDIFNTVGKTMIVDESMFPEVTVLCGSGTAIALEFFRAYMQACIQQGVNEKDALRIAIQVSKGAAALLEKKDLHPAVLVDKVTTPGGCTIAVLVGMTQGFSSALHQAIQAGIDKAKELYQ